MPKKQLISFLKQEITAKLLQNEKNNEKYQKSNLLKNPLNRKIPMWFFLQRLKLEESMQIYPTH